MTRDHKLFSHVIIKGILMFLLLLGLPNRIFSQNPVIEDIIEELTSRSGDEEADYSTYVEDLTFYLANPLNLNDANIEDLEKLHFLSEFQMENLLNYIASKGAMKTIYELQLVEGYTPDVINRLLPFVTVAPVSEGQKLKIKNVLRYGRHNLLGETGFMIQNQQGYLSEMVTDDSITPPKYLGSKEKYKLKYQFHYRDKVFAGLVAEKDPGEAFNTDGGKLGFDFYSAHIQVDNVGMFKNITLGDYQVKFGQGLVMWSGFGMGKSADVLNIRKKGQGIRYSSSTDENNFMRGAGTTVKLGKFEITAFFSRKKIDANLNQSDTLENIEEQITAFQNTGYHRTQSEMDDRKVIGETVFGSRIGMNLNSLKVAANFVGYHYDNDLVKSDKPYKLFDFEGNSNYNLSFDYHYFYRKLGFFGEAAMSKNGAFAVQNGLIASVVPQLSFSLLHRYYQEDYQAYYSNSFSENSKISNEQGLFYGIEFHPVAKVKISAYADAYQFPWLKFGVDAPSNGNEYFVQTSYLLSRNVDMYFRWRRETKSKNYNSENQPLNYLEEETKEQFRYHISYRVSQLISLRSRIEVSHYEYADSKEYGYLFYQDVNFDLRKLPISFYFRYAIFDAAYDARIYTYENDILYNFSVPGFSGKGSRFYAMVKYSPFDGLDLRVRYSQTFYPDQTTISSGLSEIQGNLRSELKFQFVLRF